MPANATEDDRGMRTYTWKGQAFPSVTSIISGGVPKYLVPWASKLVAEAAYDRRTEWETMGRESAVALLKAVPNEKRDSAANMGKDIHAAAEAHVLGKPMPEWPADIAPTMRNFERFLLDFDPEYAATEATVYNPSHGYAGTGDAWFTMRRGRLAGVPLIVDYKSGAGVYPEVALQLSAYKRGEFIGLPDGSEQPLPHAERGLVLHLRPNGCVPREIDVSEDVYKVFRHAAQIHKWSQTLSRTVIGEAVLPTEAVAA